MRKKKETIRENQSIRIETVYIIMRCFSHYNMMQMYIHGARNGNTDRSAVDAMTHSFKKMYRMELDSYDIMHFSNDMANKAVEEYSQLYELLESYFPSKRYPYSKECIISVLSHLYHHDITLRSRYIDFIFFIRYVEEIYHFRPDHAVMFLKNKCIQTCIGEDGVYMIHCDSVHFRRTFLRIEDTLDRISDQRKKRERKKDIYKGSL